MRLTHKHNQSESKKWQNYYGNEEIFHSFILFSSQFPGDPNEDDELDFQQWQRCSEWMRFDINNCNWQNLVFLQKMWSNQKQISKSDDDDEASKDVWL